MLALFVCTLNRKGIESENCSKAKGHQAVGTYQGCSKGQLWSEEPAVGPWATRFVSLILGSATVKWK